MTPRTEVIQGAPHEVGAEVFSRFCMPVIQAAQQHPPEELVQLYAGIVGAAMGSMAADFGHAMAVAIMRRTLAQFEGMEHAFDAAQEQ